MSRYKIKSIERSFQIYTHINNEFVQEIIIDFIPLESLLQIIVPKNGDHYLYDFYELNESQVEWFKDKIVFEADFSKYYYIISCAADYDWNVKIE